MICPPCRRAGALNATVNEAESHGFKAPEHREFAEDAHEQCKGGTWCDCQHKTGDFKNRRTDG